MGLGLLGGMEREQRHGVGAWKPKRSSPRVRIGVGVVRLQLDGFEECLLGLVKLV